MACGVSARRAALALLVTLLTVTLASAFKPRRIMFAKCDYPEETSVKPKAVFMTCANKKGVCEVRAGSTHTLRAVFIPTHNGTDIDSYVRWNTWVDVALPGQIRDVCNDQIQCPVMAGDIVRFTYHLELQDFWPRNEYPCIWSLTDKTTGNELMCFKFKINIV